MPKSIQTKHIKRMFPFDFYNELSEHLTDYVLHNPAFLLQDKIDVTKAKKEELFHNAREGNLLNTLNQNNLISVEPFGEVLTLEPCCKKEHVDMMIHSKEKRSKVPLSILVVQLYDSNNKPVFATDVTEDTIQQIPEVLWDDPNLLLAIISFDQQDSQVGVIRIPKQIERKLFEEVQSNKSEKSN